MIFYINLVNSHVRSFFNVVLLVLKFACDLVEFERIFIRQCKTNTEEEQSADLHNKIEMRHKI